MTILTPWPEHQNPSPHRTASAPYNFVPLPEKIIPAVDNAEDLPGHDKYYQGRHSGYFDVTLTTRSPLYIRGLLPARDLSRQEELKNKPEFFHTDNEHEPVIPGSSLRGMLRALLEIVSYSKIQWVSKKRLFFRTMDDSAVGLYYNRRMVEKLDVAHPEHQSALVYRARVEGGFFRVDDDGTYSIEPCTFARVETEDLRRLFNLAYSRDMYELDGRDLDERTARNPNQTPKWSYQHREIWAEIDEVENDYFFPEQYTRNGKIRHYDLYLRFQHARNLEESSEQDQGKKRGKLVLTGPMEHKHLAFLFVPLKEAAPRIEVTNDPSELDPNKRLVDRFHDDDQLTRWQKKAFPAGIPPNGQPRREDGHLRDGDPVFFLRNENGDLVFFGRAQMFRLPYKQRPIDLVPCELQRVTDIDYAEALFGFTLTAEQIAKMGANAPVQGKKGRAYAGRVMVTDGVLQSKREDIWLAGSPDEVTTPRILATPKPTAFQHYLTQQHPDNNKALNHYDSTPPESDETVIRGHKLYWHQGLDTDQGHTLKQVHDAIKETAYVGPKDTQHTRFKPLKPGVRFSFRVYFENLSDRELGALCWTLHPRGETGRRYCHHLGMGKPLGMGAVELHAHLHIIDRPLRYKHLFNDSGDNWQLGEASMVEDLADPKVLERLTQPFEEHLLHEELKPTQPCTRLAGMLRIAMLLKLLEWPGYRAKGDGELYLEDQQRPNTRYMELREYRYRPVLPDPRQFDEPYFNGKSRPQVSQADQLPVKQVEQNPILEQHSMPEAHLQTAIVQQAPVENNRQQSVLSPELAELFYVGRELGNLNDFTQDDRGVEVRFWKRNPKEVIGFIPNELVDRKLGNKISVIVTGLRQESSGRLVVELKLRPRR